jgi:hypothetical protein
MASERAERSRSKPGPVSLQTPRKPNIRSLLRDDLRAALEDEIIPVVEPGNQRVILQREMDEEVIKKALVGLKLPTLRQIARDRSINDKGNSEDLASRIGRSYRWNEEEVARLVLANEQEPAPERGHLDRLYPLEEALDIQQLEERLQYVQGRYIRIGVARWFTFDASSRLDDSLELVGALHAYQAHIDQTSLQPRLTATSNEDPAFIIGQQGDKFLQLSGASSDVSKAAVEAFTIATNATVLGYVPIGSKPKPGTSMAAFSAASLFMLDLIFNRFFQVGIRNINLTTARFRIGDTAIDPDDLTARPTLKAVRFEGTHLLDSASACKLLAQEGRALVDISMVMEVPDLDHDESNRFPLRISIEGDHVLVITGYGAVPGLQSMTVHQKILAAVESEVSDGWLNHDRLSLLCERISGRAQIDHVVERADVLRDVSS